MAKFFSSSIAFVLVVLLFAYITFKLLSFQQDSGCPLTLSGQAMLVNELLSRKGLNLKIEGEDYDADVPNRAHNKTGLAFRKQG